jgi:Uma2 family endonuclease
MDGAPRHWLGIGRQYHLLPRRSGSRPRAGSCYWIANEAKVRGKDEIDLSIDPPPDLALEVDVSQSSIPKLPIYQALGVSEMWRWRYGMLEVLCLDNTGVYAAQKMSKALPHFPLRLVEEFVERRQVENDTALMKAFRRAIK